MSHNFTPKENCSFVSQQTDEIVIYGEEETAAEDRGREGGLSVPVCKGGGVPGGTSVGSAECLRGKVVLISWPSPPLPQSEATLASLELWREDGGVGRRAGGWRVDRGPRPNPIEPRNTADYPGGQDTQPSKRRNTI